MATMRNIRKKGVDDLRSVVWMAGDRFELDLYHPVGTLSVKNSGLLLWSRDGKLSKELMDPSRGVVFEFEAEVLGAVMEDELRERLRAGAAVGTIGFQRTVYADLRESEVLPDSSLQSLRSRVVIATMDARAKVPELLKACGHKVEKLRRTRIGPLSLDGIEEGGFAAASPEEEDWACRLGGLPDYEYPGNRLLLAKERDDAIDFHLGLPPPRVKVQS